MLDENVWMQLSEDEKFSEIQTYLNDYLKITKGRHEFYKQQNQGKLVELKKELESKIFKILEIENIQ